MTPYEIPLSPLAQSFQIALGGVLYSLDFWWCGPASSWMLNIAAADKTPILQSIPVITGTDLLKQYKHLGIKGSLYVQTDGDLTRVPGYTDLGVGGHVYFVTED